VTTRCRLRGGVVDPPCFTASRPLRWPITHPIKYLITRSKIIQKPVSLLLSGVSSGSSLTPLNTTIDHTQSTHLASIVSLARYVVIDFSARKYNTTFCTRYKQRSHPWQRVTSEMPTRRRRTSKLWATTERRLRTEIAGPRISRRRITESRSRYC
jgi:hypothetical protein